MSVPTVSPEAIQAAQGTRKSEKAPWETYGESLDLKLTEELAAAVDEYETRRYEEDSTSNQNKEELARWKEGNAEAAKEYQFVTPDEYADEEQRKGKILHSSEFINKLRGAGVSCWYRDHPQPRKVTLLIQKSPGLPHEVGCWVQLGYMPELSIMGFDEHGVPTAERFRGWRTCLLQLILKGVITEEKANATFGKPKETEAFHRYNSTLKAWRVQQFEIGG